MIAVANTGTRERTEMNIRRLLRALALAGVALLAMSCGGGGGGGGGSEEPPPPPPPPEEIPPAPSTPIALSTKSHVLNEIGNTIGFYSAFFNLDLEARVAVAALLLPKAAEITECQRDGTRAVEQGSADRTFEFFEVTQGVTFVTEVTSGCDEDDPAGGGIHRVLDGHFEQGDTPVGIDNVSHAYERYGLDAQNRYSDTVLDDEAPADFVRHDALGLTEFRLSPTLTELRSVVERRHEERIGGSYRAATVIEGAAGDPFMLRFDHAIGALSFEGPYRYATRSCAGGQARVTTLAPLTLDDENFPDGGQLLFGNGTTTVQVTFNGDGTATFQFSGGETQTLKRDEIVASAANC